MSFLDKEKYDRFLENLAEVLDITQSQLDEAKKSYRAVGEWLCSPASPIAKYNPVVYSQGSFRLGTVIKPIADEDNFDVDVVCLLQDWPSGTSQQNLKQEVGDALKTNADYRRMLRKKEGRRCWTLQYSDSRKFHIDILPAKKDDFQWLIQAGVEFDKAQHAIEITDKECETYEECTDENWPKSNPKGYGNWFKEQMQEQLTEQKRRLASFKSVSVEKIEDFEVKTPLQRAVQILKRHRDFMFGDDPDRPISIIITTLAAKAYNNEPRLYDALINLIDNMPKHIEGEKGDRTVYNPVNPEENFADKWKEYPDREDNFYNWLSKAKEDFADVFQNNGLETSVNNLRESFGESLVNQALRKSNLENLVADRSTFRNSKRSIFSVSHRQGPLWDINEVNTVTISARYKQYGYWHTLDSTKPLLKNLSLRFIAITNVEWPYKVYWQVVNTGDEAAAAEKLRGKIFLSANAGKDAIRYNDSTAFTGTHWIECFIVKDDICVARSREFIVQIK